MNETKAIFRKASPDEISRIFEFETQYIREMEPENMDKWAAAERRTLETIENSLDHTLS